MDPPARPTLPASPALDWHAEPLRQRLDPLAPGISVEVVPRCDSTNSELLRRWRTVAGRRREDLRATLLVAEHQTQGRGRQNRPWLAAPGASLTFSLGLPLVPADWSGLSLAAGVAVADAIDPAGAVAGGTPRIGLKWPNDLWLWDGPGRGRKLGGILVETVAVGAHRVAVVGVGMNVRETADAPAAALSQGYASLAELAPAPDTSAPPAADVTAPRVLAAVAPPLLAALRRFETSGLSPLLGAFARRDVLAGRPVQTLDDHGTPLQAGVADGIDAAGALRLRTPQGVALVVSGEVSVRWPAQGMATAPPGGLTGAGGRC